MSPPVCKLAKGCVGGAAGTVGIGVAWAINHLKFTP